LELRDWEKIVLIGGLANQNEEISHQFSLLLESYKDNAEFVLQKAAEHQVLPCLAYNVVKIGEHTSFHQQVGNFLEHLLGAYRIVNGVLIENMKTLITELRRHMEILCIKGTDTLLNYYPDVGSRALGDIDILIHITDVSLFKMLARDIGYSQAFLNRDSKAMEPFPDEQISEVEKSHYELLGFTRLVDVPQLQPYQDVFPLLEKGSLYPRFTIDDLVKYVVCFDVHHNLAPDLDPNDLWNKTRYFNLGGIELRGQSLEDLLWFLSARFYHESMILNKKNLRMLYDVAAVLARESMNVDWVYFLEGVRKNDLQPSVFYVFSQLKQLFKADIPEDVIRNLHPENNIVQRSHDWGDFLPKILGRAEITSCNLLEQT